MLLRSRTFAPQAGLVGLVDAAGEVSLDEAYRRYLPYVAKLGYRLLGGGADVDDLVQDVFVAAAERLPHLRDPDALKSFLASITVRTAQRKHVRRKLRNVLFALDDRAAAELLVAPSIEGMIEARDALEVVFRVLDTAPIKDRLAWSLRNLEGEPLENVARLCRCSLATAKRRIADAQRLLEKELGHG
jgi:RNA polymerase sigma-70 factor (ECF subfamily)